MYKRQVFVRLQPGLFLSLGVGEIQHRQNALGHGHIRLAEGRLVHHVRDVKITVRALIIRKIVQDVQLLAALQDVYKRQVQTRRI